jgi:hypothetical protein
LRGGEILALDHVEPRLLQFGGNRAGIVDRFFKGEVP